MMTIQIFEILFKFDFSNQKIIKLIYSLKKNLKCFKYLL